MHFKKRVARAREWLEGLDYRLQRVTVGRGTSQYDRMRRESGLTLFRKAWWIQTRLESYRTLRRYARLLDGLQVEG